jgi:hypothetical protein
MQHTTMGSHQAVPHSTTLLCHPAHADRNSPHGGRGRLAGLPMRVMGGIDCHDVMSYCDDEWLSSFTYSGIYDRLVAEDALPAGATSGPVAAIAMTRAEGANPLGMRLIAALNLTRTSGTITSVLLASGGDAPARGAEPQETTVRVLDANGAILDERPVPFQRSACEDPDDDVTGIVDAVLPSFEGAATSKCWSTAGSSTATRSGRARPRWRPPARRPGGGRARRHARRSAGTALGGTRRAARSALHRPGQ